MLDETDRFIEAIQSAPLNVEFWWKQQAIVEEYSETSSLFDVGFATFFLNRTNRSGIIMGAGPIGGYKQTGRWLIDARFPREALCARVKWLADRRDSIQLHNKDGLAFLKDQARLSGQETFFFIDPPYVNAGRRLYLNAMSEMQHLDLAKYIIGNKDMPYWMVTYDDHPLIRSAYSEASVADLSVRYTLQKKRSADELIIEPAS